MQRVARRCSTSCRFLCSWAATAWRSYRLARLALLLLLPAHVAAQTAITNANIGAAATAWASDSVTATTTYGLIADWNTAAVTSMASVFSGKTTFNSDISKWNTVSVLDMSEVFHIATAFNGNIGSWNVASVSNMGSMFDSASTFNQNIASWNVASVASMLSMFNSATAFDQNLASWNVLRVNAAGWVSTWTSAGLSNCHGGAMYSAWGSSFQGVWPAYASYACVVSSVCAKCITNANVAAAVTAWTGGDATTYGNIVEWNTAGVTSMAGLFATKQTFNGDISKWNIASVSNMQVVRLDLTWAAYSLSYASSSLSTHHPYTYAPTCASACARACAWVFWRTGVRARALSDGVDRVWFGSQAFTWAFAFNADIGAWNTASVTKLYQVS